MFTLYIKLIILLFKKCPINKVKYYFTYSVINNVMKYVWYSIKKSSFYFMCV